MSTNKTNASIADDDKCECAYCGHTVDAPGDEEAPPAKNDDAAWEKLAAQHAPDCDWILTRAHRLDRRATE